MSGANANTSSNQRRRDIQGLRGVAVALVVLYHSGLPVPGGFIGVDVFFVVSGFVITLMLKREFDATGSIGFGRFYSRRARRLLPALGLMLTVIGFLSIAVLGPLGQQQQALDTGISASLFVANFQLIAAPGGYFAAAAENNPFLHTWSLSVEEQFYLFLPLTLAVLWRISTRRKRPITRETLVGGAILAVVAVSFFLSYYLSAGSGADLAQAQARAFYSSITRVWEFGIGVLLALAAQRLTVMPRVAAGALGTAGIGLIAIGALTIGDATPFPGMAATMPVLGTAMLIAAGSGSSLVWTTRALSTKPVVWVGDLSYSWYLWHWPLIVFAQTLWPTSPAVAPLAAAVSLAPAVLAYHHVEQPIRLGERFPNANGFRTATAAIVASLFALAILDLSGRVVRNLPEVAELTHITRYHVDATSGCDIAEAEYGTDCAWHAHTARGSVYLVGDSNAGQFTEAIAAAAADAGFDFTLAVRSGCPPIDVEALHRGHPKEHCSDFPGDAVAAIRRDKPDIVVLAAASDLYIGQDRWVMIDPQTGEMVGDTAGKARLWQQGLETLLYELEQSGTEVHVVNPIPHFFAADDIVRVDDCPAIRLISDTTTCGAQALRSELDAQRHHAVQAELAAVTTVPAATAVDFFDALCPGTSCAMYTEGRWLYRDGTHLSVDGSLELTDSFYALLTAG